jgi:DNA polymerase III alpha subunit
MPDIDIDFKDREKALSLFKHVRASRIDEGELTKHNTGVYMHEVPTDPIKYVCSIEHKEAEEQGLFKIEDGIYYFKKSHAIAYAVAVVVHMNLICEQLYELGS